MIDRSAPRSTATAPSSEGMDRLNVHERRLLRGGLRQGDRRAVRQFGFSWDYAPENRHDFVLQAHVTYDQGSRKATRSDHHPDPRPTPSVSAVHLMSRRRPRATNELMLMNIDCQTRHAPLAGMGRRASRRWRPCMPGCPAPNGPGRSVSGRSKNQKMLVTPPYEMRPSSPRRRSTSGARPCCENGRLELPYERRLLCAAFDRPRRLQRNMGPAAPTSKASTA
jgi:hypothetical protein